MEMLLPWQQRNCTKAQQYKSILSSYLAHIFFVTYISLIYLVIMETLFLGIRESLLYLIFIFLGEQKLILLGHESFVAISVGVADFHMQKCWDLKFFIKLLQNLLPLCSKLNDRSFSTGKYLRPISCDTLSPVLASMRRACRAGEKSHLLLYMLNMFLQKFYGVQKSKIFLVTFGSASLCKTTCP